MVHIPFHSMSSIPSVEPGTFVVRRDEMLFNDVHAQRRDDARASSPDRDIPAFPFSDVPVYADTADISTLAFHDFWGCLLTPDNVAAGICTDTLGYHVWVATMRVVESGRIQLTDKEALICAVTDQFMVEFGLVLLDQFPGPLILFVDPRLHDDPQEMVLRAIAIVAKFDAAQVRRWRIIVTLPATEDGIWAAHVLTNRHGIQTNLSLVACLAHAAACIEAGATTVSMSVRPIMAWFEQQPGVRARPVSPDHPGIEAVQSCATFIRHHGIKTTLLTTDVKWAELKQLRGIGATALTKAQLDAIPRRRLTTWVPRPADNSDARRADYPSHYLDANRAFFDALPAESRSVVCAVLYVRLAKMAEQMATIDGVVWDELERRIRLETTPLERVCRRPSISAVVAAVMGTPERGRSGRTRARSRSPSPSPTHRAPTRSKSRSRRSEPDRT